MPLVLERRLKRHLGIGNATGLGMAPFLVSHPILMHKWVLARETALARCLEVAAVSAATAARIGEIGERAARHLGRGTYPMRPIQSVSPPCRVNGPRSGVTSSLSARLHSLICICCGLPPLTLVLPPSCRS